MPLTPGAMNNTMVTLSAARPVSGRLMFGGGGFYHDELFFGVLIEDRLYFKVDAETLPEYDALGMKPWINDGVEKPYREVPADVQANPETLGEWIDRATDVVRRAAANRKKT